MAVSGRRVRKVRAPDRVGSHPGPGGEISSFAFRQTAFLWARLWRGICEGQTAMRRQAEEGVMASANSIFGRAGLAAGLLLAGMHAAAARDLTVVSWGGNYQDAQRRSISSRSRRRPAGPCSTRAGTAASA
jgi:hypothetical protein